MEENTSDDPTKKVNLAGRVLCNAVALLRTVCYLLHSAACFFCVLCCAPNCAAALYAAFFLLCALLAMRCAALPYCKSLAASVRELCSAALWCLQVCCVLVSCALLCAVLHRGVNLTANTNLAG